MTDENAPDTGKPKPGDQALLNTLQVRLIKSSEQEQWDELMARHHYLGLKGIVGETLRYVAALNGQWTALIGWGAAAFKSRHRDEWIGWQADLHFSRLNLIANNVRFLVLPEFHIKNLASKALSLNLKRLSSDWKSVYGHPILLAETFVDMERFAGTCYRAAGWTELGETRGFGRRGGKYYHHGHVKALFIRPLRKDAAALLSDPTPHPELSEEGFRINMKTCKQGLVVSLIEILRQVPDPRHKRGVRFRFLAVLATAVCAVLSGARSYAAMADWAEDATPTMRRRLGFPYDVKTKKRLHPSEPTIRRVLQSVDADAVDKLIGQWLLGISGKKEGDGIAIDGKTLRGAVGEDGKQVMLLSAFMHKQGVVISQEQVDSKSNEIPAVKPLLKDVDIKGMVVTADALHTQHETAKFIVVRKNADYLFIVKGNQPTLEEDIKLLKMGNFPPSSEY
jgi:hypothetical protein